MIAYNLSRAAGALTGTVLGKARTATIRATLINVPARITRPQGTPTLHLPEHWPHAGAWNTLWTNVFTAPSRQVAA